MSVNLLPSEPSSLTPRSRLKTWLSTGAGLLTWTIILWLLAWNLLRIWPGERLWLVAISNYFAPWLMLVSLTISLGSFALKRPALGITALIAGGLILIRLLPSITGSQQHPLDVQVLKVMSFNLHDRNKDIEGTAAVILEEGADIIALQELIPSFRDPLLASLESEYPFHTLVSGEFSRGLGLFSRYPLSDIYRSIDPRVISATVHTPAGPLLVVNVHAPSNYFPLKWGEVRTEQATFLGRILDEFSDIEGPLLLLGDFNFTTLSENYALLNERYHDAFADSGTGFGFTYPTSKKFGIKPPWPIVRIDYVFYNDFFISMKTTTIKESGGSDHRPIFAVLGYN